nr:ionotropic receptor [Odontothrips loti]
MQASALRTPGKRAVLSFVATATLLVAAVPVLVPGVRGLEAEVAVEVSRSVFQHKGLGHILAVLCNHHDALLWERSFAEGGSTFIATPVPSAGGPDVLRALEATRSPLGVFLHAGCPGSLRVLQESSAAGLLGGSRHWVLAGDASTARADLERLADTLDLGPDSELTLASVAANTETVHLVDAYRASPGPPGPGRPMVTVLTATWTATAGLKPFLAGSAATRRRDLRGTVLRAGVLVSGYREAELEKVLSKPKDNNPLVSPVAAFSHTLTMHLQDMLNVTLRLQGGPFFKLLRRLRRHDLQLLATASDMEAGYWDVLDYTATPLWTERRVLVLKNPSALWSYDAWLRPLDTKVWIIIVTLILSTAVVLRAVGYWEVHFDRGHVEEEDTWLSAITTALSMVCAQGFSTTTSWTSSRALLLMFEFFSLFVNLFYTSGIVTFLLTFPPPFAHTVREMVDSPFVVGADEAVFSRQNFTESGDPLLRQLYDEKIAEAGGGGGFLPLRQAGDLARAERFAIVGSPFPIYDMVATKWSPSDICRYQEIPLMPPSLLAIATAKRSPFREILNQAILVLVERGLPARERLRWSVLRPRCQLSDVTELDFVGLRAVTPLLGFVVAGLTLSLIFLALELVSSRYTNRNATVMDLLKGVMNMSSDATKKAA